MLLGLSNVYADNLPRELRLEAAPLVTEEKQASRVDFAVGAQIKTKSGWSPERRLHLAGRLDQIIYRVPAANVTQTWTAAVQQLKELGARELFSCAGAACGSDKAWALGHFHSELLLGRPSYQRYSAYLLDQNQYYAIYLSRLSNKPAAEYRLLMRRIVNSAN